MDEVLAQLVALGPDDASYTASMLRGSYLAQRDVLAWVKALEGRKDLTIMETGAECPSAAMCRS